MKLLVPYIGSFFALLVLDFLWLEVVMKGFYEENIGHLMAENLNLFVGIAFYLLYVAGIFIFAVLPAVRMKQGRRAALLGAMLGVIAYGTYDLTNMATLENWPFLVTAVDLLWGTFLTAVIAVIGFSMVQLYNQPKKPVAVG